MGFPHATGLAPTRSEHEDVVLDLILGAGLAHPDVNAVTERRLRPHGATKPTLGMARQRVMWNTNLNLVGSSTTAINSISPRALR